MASIIFLLILSISAAFLFKKPDILLGMVMALELLSMDVKESQSLFLIWGIFIFQLYAFFNYVYIKKIRLNHFWFFTIVFLGLYMAISGFISGAGSGTPIRYSISVIVSLLWGYYSSKSYEVSNGWFIGISFIVVLNLLFLVVPFIPKVNPVNYEGFERSDTLSYLHTTGLLSSYLIVSCIYIYFARNYQRQGSRYPSILQNKSNLILLFSIIASLFLLYKTFARGSIFGLLLALILLPFSMARAKSNNLVRYFIRFTTVIILVFFIVQFLVSTDLGHSAYLSFQKAINRDLYQKQYSRIDNSLASINLITNKYLWFGIGNMNPWDMRIFAPHFLPLSYTLYFGLPVGVIILLIFLCGLIRSLRYFLLTINQSDNIRIWFYLSVLLISLSVGLTNGAIALGYGFQWYVFGAAIGFHRYYRTNKLR